MWHLRVKSLNFVFKFFRELHPSRQHNLRSTVLPCTASHSTSVTPKTLLGFWFKMADNPEKNYAPK